MHLPPFLDHSRIVLSREPLAMRSPSTATQTTRSVCSPLKCLVGFPDAAGGAELRACRVPARGMTSNHTILPDGHGSAVFKAMLDDLGLTSKVAMARHRRES